MIIISSSTNIKDILYLYIHLKIECESNAM